MKKRVVIFVLIAAGFLDASAQTKGIAVFLRGGYTYAPGAKKILAEIAPYEISGFTSNFTLLGLEGYYRTNKWIMGLEGTVGTQADYSKDQYHAQPYIGAAHFRLGSILYEGKQWWLYPSVGAGTSVTTLSVNEKLINKSGKIMNLNLYSPSFDLGINADLLTSKESRQQKKAGGLIIGFRAGYRFSPESDNWKDDKGNKITNLPSYRNNAFYITLIAAGGYFINK